MTTTANASANNVQLADEFVAIRPSLPGVSAKHTIKKVAETVPSGFLANSVADTKIDWTNAASNLNFAGAASQAVSASITPAQADNLVGNVTAGTIVATQIDFTGAGSDGNFVNAVNTAETVFAATSTGNTVTITAAGTKGHTPNLEVNWAGVPDDGFSVAKIDWGTSGADADFGTAVGGRTAEIATAMTATQAGEIAAKLAVNTINQTAIDFTGVASDANFISAVQSIGATNEIFTDNLSLSGTTLTGTDNNGNTLFRTNLAAFASVLVAETGAGLGTYTHTSGTGAVTVIDTRATATVYDNTTSGLTAGTTQEAIDEVVAGLPYDNTTSGLTATTVPAAIDEVQAALVAGQGVSTDANNILGNGSDGKPFLTTPTTYFA